VIRKGTDYQRALVEISQLEADIDVECGKKHVDSGRGVKKMAKENLLAQLRNETEAYRSMEKGEIKPLDDISKIGEWLITLRLSRGLSDHEFGELTGVSLKQVSNDERNNYSRIGVQRAHRLLQALGIEYQLRRILPEPALEMPMAIVIGSTDVSEPELGAVAMDVPAQVAAVLRSDKSISMEQALHLSYAFDRLYATYVSAVPVSKSESQD
jgi:transcriptional regulator with XRE-family HTH domain